MKKVTVFICLCFMLSLFAGVAAAGDKNTFVKATYGTIRTLDPATCYDTSGGSIARQHYEMLVQFDGPSTEKFAPFLATNVPTVANGGISKDGKTYTFDIRKGVKFQSGGTLTPADVEYCLERSMLVDQNGGPSWMLLEAMVGVSSTKKDDKVVPGIFKKIMDSVEVKGNKVVLHLANPYPPLLGILQGSWGSIYSKKWAIGKGAWDGKLASAAKYHSPAINKEPLQRAYGGGTGAYELTQWEPSKQIVMERFDGYWGKKPAIKTYIKKYVEEWTTRKLMLQNGDADTVTVDNSYFPEVEKMKGIKIHKVPQLAVSMGFFNREINMTGNPDVGSGKLDGNGITSDFFQDINVRKGFLHAVDYEALKYDVSNGLIENPGSPNIIGLPYYKKVPMYKFDMKKAASYMKKAHGGKVWKNGFKFTITHNVGNTVREAAARMVAENINSMNPKFKIDVRGVEWKVYTAKYRQSVYPMFLIGWGADYPDPHNFLHTFMHSQGVYGKYSHYVNPRADKLCEEGILTADAKKRKAIYYELQDLWRSDAVGIGLYQPVLVKVYRNEVSGFVANPMFGDAWENMKVMKKK